MKFFLISCEKATIDFCVSNDFIGNRSEVLLFVSGCEVCTFVTNEHDVDVVIFNTADEVITYSFLYC